MKALLLTQGTRGDVQPFLALARALHRAGHSALVAGPAASAGLAAEHGVDYHPVDDGPTALMGDPELGGAMATGLRGLRGTAEAVKVMRRIKPLMGRVYAGMADAAEGGADVVVYNPSTPGGHIAEYLGVPAVPALLQPTWVPTAAFPAAGFPAAQVPAALNRATYTALALSVRALAPVADRLRAERLGLPRRPGRHDILRQADGTFSTVLQGFSRHLLPAHTGYPDRVHTTGFWFPPASGAGLDRRVEAFLAAGPPPVFIGFSSMPGADPARSGRMMAGAARAAGVRAVIASGWGGIDASAHTGDDVLVIGTAPHDLLFPRCAAVVHHGGGGTTGAALAAGRPQVICPFWGDQPFWAERAHASGAAVRPLRGQEMTAERLAAAITEAVTSTAMAARARDLGELARAEAGAEGAVRILERVRGGTDPAGRGDGAGAGA
ncbi:glycosyltransferase [Streptomonospora sp. S1-112]|uniref:Glycosyltransferase n=1 Tax=Streptomonospora mangrovi TaxID=2883123 RepID=A0A9X3NRQ1_9ACTN|nr:glycosyltransferase [Streptomonospora mangrovi]MDA0566844.1 glycosyltransferase [Streptomonospora mangrovi]